VIRAASRRCRGRARGGAGQANILRCSGAPTAPWLRSAPGIFSRAMTNCFNLLLHADDVRWAAALHGKNRETWKLSRRGPGNLNCFKRLLSRSNRVRIPWRSMLHPLQDTPIHVVSECEGLAPQAPPAAPSPPSGHASQTPPQTTCKPAPAVSRPCFGLRWSRQSAALIAGDCPIPPRCCQGHEARFGHATGLSLTSCFLAVPQVSINQNGQE
jgi:hypothetical protein